MAELGRGGCLITYMCHGEFEEAGREGQSKFGGAGGHGLFSNLRLPIENVSCEQESSCGSGGHHQFSRCSRDEDQVQLQT